MGKMYSVFVYFLRADYMSMARRLMKLAPLSRFFSSLSLLGELSQI